MFSEAARSPTHYEMLDERETASGLKDWLIGKDKLDLQRSTHLSDELASQWKRPLEVPKDASEIPSGEGAGLDQLDEPSSEQASSQEEVIPSAKKLKTIDREASYVIVASPGGIFRLHRAGSYGCWMGRKRDFRDATEFDTKPPTSCYYVGRLRRTTEIANRASRPIHTRDWPTHLVPFGGSSISCSMPVREIEEFGGPEESQANAWRGGGHNPPVSL